MSEIPYKSIYIASKLKEIDDLRTALANAEKAFQYMADFSPHCCEDCPCDEFRNKSEQQLAEIRRVLGGK